MNVSDVDQVLFVANDVAKALGYARPYEAVKQHCVLFQIDKTLSTVKHGIKKRNRGNPNIVIIPESDVYRLIIKSKVKSPLFG